MVRPPPYYSGVPGSMYRFSVEIFLPLFMLKDQYNNSYFLGNITAPRGLLPARVGYSSAVPGATVNL